MWEPQAAALTGSFRVVRPDLRGFGDTPLPAEPYSHGRDVVVLMDHLGVPAACVVGSSLGGRVALEMATSFPDRVERLVLLCPALAGFPATPDADAFEEAEERLIEDGDVAGAVELNVRTWLGPEADEATRDSVRRMQRHAFDVQLAAEAEGAQPTLERPDVDPAEIRAPTLVVTGGKDMDHFQAVAAHLAATIPDSRQVRLDWAGHLPSLERPEPVTSLIADFCR